MPFAPTTTGSNQSPGRHGGVSIFEFAAGQVLRMNHIHPHQRLFATHSSQHACRDRAQWITKRLPATNDIAANGVPRYVFSIQHVASAGPHNVEAPRRCFVAVKLPLSTGTCVVLWN